MNAFAKAQIYSSSYAFDLPEQGDPIGDEQVEELMEKVSTDPDHVSDALNQWLEKATPEEEAEYREALLAVLIMKSTLMRLILDKALYAYCYELLETGKPFKRSYNPKENVTRKLIKSGLV